MTTPTGATVRSYVKKTPVDAVQWTGGNFDAVAAFLRDLQPGIELENAGGVLLVGKEDNGQELYRIGPGYWAVGRGDVGFYWVDPQGFAERYALADGASVRSYVTTTPVNAVQWTGGNFDAVAAFLRELQPFVVLKTAGGVLLVEEADGREELYEVTPGQWAVGRGDVGFYWVDPQGFAERYKLAEDGR